MNKEKIFGGSMRWKKAVALMLACALIGILVLSHVTEKTVYASEDVISYPLDPSIDTVLTSVKNYVLSKDTNPDFSSCWNVIGLSRSNMEVPQSYKDTFYSNVIAYLKEKNWSFTKSTDYSKVILAMTAIGKNAENIEGHNLLAYLSDFNNVKKQGVNGPIWALIALKSNPEYNIPLDSSVSEHTTEEGLITYLLDRETTSGGWTLTGNVPDSDLTGMAIQALTSYYNKREDVTAAIDRALAWLSESQELLTGGFSTMGGETSESSAQIIVALSSLGFDCSKDARFVKYGEWPMKALFSFYLPEGGFMHVKPGGNSNGGGAAGTLNGMATEQGLYATVAYQRLLDEKTALYDMSDINLSGTEESATNPSGNTSASNSPTTTNQENITQTTVKVISVKLDYSEINLKVGKTKTLKATVTPTNASNTAVKWTTSNKKVATVSQKGKVTAKGAGTAKITAASQDGSEIKAVCTVKVIKAESTATATTAATKTTSAKTATTKKVNLTSSSDGKTTANETEEDTTQADGSWTFEAEQYVPESVDAASEEDDTDEKEEDGINIPYADEIVCMEMGGAAVALVWAIWWFGYKKKKLGLTGK